jgi:hypothetical protein
MEKVVRDKTKKHPKTTKGFESDQLRKTVFEQIVYKILDVYDLCAKGEEKKEEEEEEGNKCRHVLFLMLRIWLDSVVDDTMQDLARVMLAANELLDKIKEDKNHGNG